MIPYGKQSIDKNDIIAVEEVLRSEYLTQGPAVPRFEREICRKVGAKYGVACNSATSALHIACLSLGLGPGDLFWTSPTTFVATANCGIYCGAEIDFVDIDPDTFNICAEKFENKLNLAKRQGRLPKVLITVHMCGQSPEMDRIYGLAKSYGIQIIEDASHAIGAEYKGVPVGSGFYSDITVFSFHPVKIITTGEGGIALTNDKEIANKLLLYRSHGVTRDEESMVSCSDGPWYYEQLELGWNYRMTDIHAALGISQLKRIDKFIERRRELARVYIDQLADANLDLPVQILDAASAWHLFVVRIKEVSRRRFIFEELRNRGIGVNVHYIPVHLQPYYSAFGFKDSDFPNSVDYYKRAISIPIHPSLTNREQEFIISEIKTLAGTV